MKLEVFKISFVQNRISLWLLLQSTCYLTS